MNLEKQLMKILGACYGSAKNHTLAKQAILTAVAESEQEAYKRGYIQGGIDEILRHEKASNEVLAQLGKEE